MSARRHTLSSIEKAKGAAVINAVALDFGVDPRDMTGSSKRDIFSRPRLEAYRRLHDDLGLSFTQVGLLMGRNRETIFYGYRSAVRKGPSHYLSHFRDGRPRYRIEDAGYETHCWLWAGCVGPDGYAKWRHKDKTNVAHRIIYEMLVGSIPDGLELDHLCNNRACVNPEHLEPVTPLENVRRRDERLHAIRAVEHRIAADPDTARAVREITAVLELGE